MEEMGLAVGERIGQVRGARSQERFADDLGVSVSSVRRYEGGVRLPDTEFLILLREREGVSADWLLTGAGSRRRIDSDSGVLALDGPSTRPSYGGGPAPKIRIDVAGNEHFVSPDDYRWIPVLNVKVTGGHGADIREENVLAFNAYRKDWLASKGLLEAALSMVTVTADDSMYPELRRGDNLLVNHSDAAVASGSIYVLRQSEDLIVKYLQKLPGNRIQVVSENAKNFPAFEIGPEDFAGGEFEIIGRVVHQGRDR